MEEDETSKILTAGVSSEKTSVIKKQVEKPKKTLIRRKRIKNATRKTTKKASLKDGSQRKAVNLALDTFQEFETRLRYLEEVQLLWLEWGLKDTRSPEFWDFILTLIEKHASLRAKLHTLQVNRSHPSNQ